MSTYQHYVYAYLRASDNSPYYIGKGKGARYKERHSVSVPKDRSKIVFLETNLSDVGACALERRYIRWYGRKNLGNNGILHNKTDGGEGVCGIVRTLSLEHRAKLSKAHKGKKISPEAAAKSAAARVGLKRSDATKIKMSLAQKGRSLSESHLAAIRSRPPITAEQKQKLIENVRKSNQLKIEMGTHYNLRKIECPHCHKIGQDRAMKRWHFSKCKIKE